MKTGTHKLKTNNSIFTNKKYTTVISSETRKHKTKTNKLFLYTKKSKKPGLKNKKNEGFYKA